MCSFYIRLMFFSLLCCLRNFAGASASQTNRSDYTLCAVVRMYLCVKFNAMVFATLTAKWPAADELVCCVREEDGGTEREREWKRDGDSIPNSYICISRYTMPTGFRYGMEFRFVRGEAFSTFVVFFILKNSTCNTIFQFVGRTEGI